MDKGQPKIQLPTEAWFAHAEQCPNLWPEDVKKLTAAARLGVSLYRTIKKLQHAQATNNMGDCIGADQDLEDLLDSVEEPRG